MAGRLKLHVIASGSKGNASIVEDGATGRCVLVDCGVTKRALLAGCEASAIDPARIEAVLVTHDHSDHVKGLPVAYRGLAKLGCHPDLFVNDAVFAAVPKMTEAAELCCRHGMEHGDALSVAGMDVQVFPTSHDAVWSCGFRFECEGDALGFMTDSGVVTPEAHEALSGVRILALESNHDLDMLKNGPYPYQLKARVRGDRGHLSNVQAACELSELVSDRLEQVVSMHVSQNNNTYRLPVDTLTGVVTIMDADVHVQTGHQTQPINVM